MERYQSLEEVEEEGRRGGDVARPLLVFSFSASSRLSQLEEVEEGGGEGGDDEEGEGGGEGGGVDKGEGGGETLPLLVQQHPALPLLRRCPTDPWSQT